MGLGVGETRHHIVGSRRLPCQVERLQAFERAPDPRLRHVAVQTMRMLLIVTVLAVAMAGVTLAGGLDSLASDDQVSVPHVLKSLAVWWGLACLMLLLVAGFRSKPKETSLAVISALLAVLVAEAVLRFTYPPSWRRFVQAPSPEYHHVNLPNQHMYFGSVLGADVFVTTNEDGLRSRYSRREYLTHRHRIAVLGDSFTFGFRVRQEQAFPQVLEQLLQDKLSKDIAVLNAGVVSYSPLLAERLFDGVIRHYRPTLVLYCLDPTDIGDDYKYAKALVASGDRTRFHRPGASTPSYYGAVAQVIHLDALIEVGLRPLRWLQASLGETSPELDWYDFRLRVGDRLETNRFFIYRHPLAETRPYFETSFAHVEALAEAVRKVGADFLLVILPRFQHWNPRECPENREAADYSLRDPYQYDYLSFFEGKRADVSFEIFNLLPAFRATKRFPLVFRDDPHWNDAGHQFVAETMADHLIRSKRFE